MVSTRKPSHLRYDNDGQMLAVGFHQFFSDKGRKIAQTKTLGAILDPRHRSRKDAIRDGRESSALTRIWTMENGCIEVHVYLGPEPPFSTLAHEMHHAAKTIIRHQLSLKRHRWRGLPKHHRLHVVDEMEASMIEELIEFYNVWEANGFKVVGDVLERSGCIDIQATIDKYNASIKSR